MHLAAQGGDYDSEQDNGVPALHLAVMAAALHQPPRQHPGTAPNRHGYPEPFGVTIGHVFEPVPLGHASLPHTSLPQRFNQPTPTPSGSLPSLNDPQYPRGTQGDCYAGMAGGAGDCCAGAAGGANRWPHWPLPLI